MKATHPTESFASQSRVGAHASGWVLAVALDCERLSAAPQRIPLERATVVEIGRGAERAFRLEGAGMRIDLRDRWTSTSHARLTAGDDGWVVEDRDSKNGVRVNGQPVQRAALVDGDVLECGGTFFVLRRVTGPVAVLPPTPTDGLWTMSPAFERELQILGKVAKAKVPVMVRGESGSGKEVAAAAIHARSGRSGPLCPLNCGAIPATLVESTLFGSRKGAYSGAEERLGLIRSADKGTLFLDEIAELPLASQAALLRVLDDGLVLPVGATKEIAVDVRVIAATNRPMEQLVAEERFRGDLYARLRGFEIHLPRLRDRREDLGFLIAAILARLDPTWPQRTLSRSAARALFLHPFPSNIRELQHVLRTALAVAAGPEITLEDLRLITTPSPPKGEGAGPVAPEELGERDGLIALLTRHAGNLNAVARDLATSRSQVRRLLARNGLARDDFQRPKGR